MRREKALLLGGHERHPVTRRNALRLKPRGAAARQCVQGAKRQRSAPAAKDERLVAGVPLEGRPKGGQEMVPAVRVNRCVRC